MAEVKCPKCDTPITYTDADEGKALECGSCGAAIITVALIVVAILCPGGHLSGASASLIRALLDGARALA